MARVGELDGSALPADLQTLWKTFSTPPRDFTNQVRVLAHSPDAFRHLYGLIEALRSSPSLSPRLIEIAVVTTSRVNACPYCVGHHGAALAAHGLEPETIENILEPDVPGLSEKERLVRDYARLVSERAWGIRDSVFEDLSKHFDEREIVELTVRIGLCTLFNKFNQALQIDAETSLMTMLSGSGLEAGEGMPTSPARTNDKTSREEAQ
ncbi:Phage infection protein [Candidatus Filomicrobium marinum]|uniref:Phage infection protein n=2 Tax=Filomicrobium TaxID=119044 RepID=A0A0D6JGR1_9HYPH|nr:MULTISPECIES: carboxymuconolactone decarboxylase family protein [Filomicrobium]MCV0370006.1 carboxymuconolactone decarboxylase family protein [Filomicrobium sp.]CFX28377.1 Phage infection protein [Candidatus Filomicrobium marinum]CPR19683.1 Phage infection protein [Candidatus Filomicrobium marinum]SDO03069.1 uncharacterized peroxidase-related enzyme [Filomicrobium insigne]